MIESTETIRFVVCTKFIFYILYFISYILIYILTNPMEQVKSKQGFALTMKCSDEYYTLRAVRIFHFANFA